MQVEFWKKRWQEDQIGFHLPETNPYIDKFWSEFNMKPGSTIFIPLCGKSLDISWFASKQYDVLGIECSSKAVESYFSEHGIQPTKSTEKEFNVYKHKNITLLQGDFFKLDKNILSTVDAVYDRASLIALPEDIRKQYAELLSRILPEHVSIMLVTLEYDQSLMSGPPFSVSNDEVQQHYQANFNVELLSEHDILESQLRFKSKGLNYLIERVYKITRR